MDRIAVKSESEIVSYIHNPQLGTTRLSMANDF